MKSEKNKNRRREMKEAIKIDLKEFNKRQCHRAKTRRRLSQSNGDEYRKARAKIHAKENLHVRIFKNCSPQRVPR